MTARNSKGFDEKMENLNGGGGGGGGGEGVNDYVIRRAWRDNPFWKF